MLTSIFFVIFAGWLSGDKLDFTLLCSNSVLNFRLKSLAKEYCDTAGDPATVIKTKRNCDLN